MRENAPLRRALLLGGVTMKQQADEWSTIIITVLAVVALAVLDGIVY